MPRSYMQMKSMAFNLQFIYAIADCIAMDGNKGPGLEPKLRDKITKTNIRTQLACELRFAECTL